MERTGSETSDWVEVEVPDGPPPDDEDDDMMVEGEEDDEMDNVEEVFGEEGAEGAQGAGTIEEEVEDVSQFTFSGHSDAVYCAAIHPTRPGVVLTGGGDDRAFLWTYSAAAVLESCHELKGHTDTVTSVDFNFDGSLALTGGYDGIVKVWDVQTGELRISLEGPEDVEWARWHSKGNAVIAGSRDGTAWMWMAHDGTCMQVFAGHDGDVSCGTFTGDGKFVVTGGADGTVRVWSPKNGSCKHVFSGAVDGFEGMVTCLVSSPDGSQVLAGAQDGTVRLYHVSNKRTLSKLVHSKAVSLDLPPQPSTGGVAGATPPAAPEDNATMDDAGGAPEEQEEVESVECVGIAVADMRWCASGGMDKTLKIWDMTSGDCRAVCTHPGGVVALRWHAALPLVGTAALDNVLRLWDARSGLCLRTFTGHTGMVTNLDMHCVNEQADIFVSVSDDHTVKVFHFNSRELINA